MGKACPISYSRVDERQVRMHAMYIALVGTGYLTSFAPFFIALLVYDFAVRIFVSANVSPVFWLSRVTVRALRTPVHYVDAGPKKFAAKIGLSVTVPSLYLALFGHDLLAAALVGVLVICATLEAVFNYCLGCEIYSWLHEHDIEIVSLHDDP